MAACASQSAHTGGVPTLIQGGVVVNHDQQFHADVLIEDGLVSVVDPSGQIKAPAGAKVIDATGKLVMPGGIDPHTHLHLPFMGTVACDDFFSGQAAAAAGGMTMHIDFALPVDHDIEAGFEASQAQAQKSCIDYSLHCAITRWSPQVSETMGRLVDRGVNSFKFYLAYKGDGLMVNDADMLGSFQRCRELGALPMVHAENGDAVACGQEEVFWRGITGPEGHALSRPAVVEGEATARAIKLARFVGAPLYVVHVMSADAMEEVAKARKDGQRVIGEPIISGLALNESMMWHPDFKIAAQYVMSPPIRSAEHGAALRKALAQGTLQLVGTDHAVFNSTQKAAGRGDFRKIPNGVNGIEERMHVVWETMVNSGMMTPMDYVRVTSTAAAQIFNMYPRKGRIAAGSDADMILFDPEEEHVLSASTHHSRMDTNVYEGMKIKGRVVATVSRGRLLWEDGKLYAQPETGRFIPLPTGGALFHGLDKHHESEFVPTRYGPTPVDRPQDSGAKTEL
ncbi:hypothetical protein FOA52_010742 [Chlamydomonas sp. UWO 241]|nr:hypothetical protein FOA52_010742 [Chlamydomonas sp. UWO 241]